MRTTYQSRLSYKRILISLLFIVLMRPIANLVNLLVDDFTISYTFSFNFVAGLLIFYDWNLFGIHYNRMKANLSDFFIYTIIGLILFGIWVYFNYRLLGDYVLVPDPKTIQNYLFASPAIHFAFSFSQSLIISIGFKCLTDHLDIREKELLIILASGFLFGLFYTVLFIPYTLEAFVRTYLYNVIVVSIMSYLYNQSSSFLPGTFAYGIVLLLFQLF